jgi:hypothetical protein
VTFTVSSHEGNGVIILDVAGTFVGTAGATLRGQVDSLLWARRRFCSISKP